MPCFGREIHFLSKFSSKNQNGLFIKFGIYTNSIMVNSMVKCICPVLDRKYPSWTNSYKKSKLFQMKVGTRTNLNMLNSMIMFICLALDGKYTFWANLIFTIKVGTEPNSNILNSVALFNFFFCTGNTHCVKGVQIRSFFWSVISRIRTAYGEIWVSHRI